MNIIFIFIIIATIAIFLIHLSTSGNLINNLILYYNNLIFMFSKERIFLNPPPFNTLLEGLTYYYTHFENPIFLFSTYISISILLKKFKHNFAIYYIIIQTIISLIFSFDVLFNIYIPPFRFYLMTPFYLHQSIIIYYFINIISSKFKNINIKIFFNNIKITFSTINILKFGIFLLIGFSSFYGANKWQSNNLGPYIRKNDQEKIVWLKNNLDSNSIVCINYPSVGLSKYGNWLESLVYNSDKEIYIYYGHIYSLLLSVYPIYDQQALQHHNKRTFDILKKNKVFERLEFFNIIFIENMYSYNILEIQTSTEIFPGIYLFTYNINNRTKIGNDLKEIKIDIIG